MNLRECLALGDDAERMGLGRRWDTRRFAGWNLGLRGPFAGNLGGFDTGCKCIPATSSDDTKGEFDCYSPELWLKSLGNR